MNETRHITRISAVSYLNSSPFVYGLQHNMPAGLFNLELDIPSVCAEKLLSGKVDLGLVPVAVIPKLKEYHIVSDYCIGGDGPVRSVMLYSDVDLPEIETVLLDPQSRTSVMLAQVLARYSWKINPRWQPAPDGHEKNIGGRTAGVVIGDRTFALENKFRFSFDLSAEWMKFAGLPFAFACWVSTRTLPPSFTGPFNEALAWGLAHREEMIHQMKNLPAPPAVIKDYLTRSISYRLDERKRKGMEKFFSLVRTLERNP